jgi:hypothetical protein
MIIAWRSIFHAIFEKQGIEYFYTKDGAPEIIDDDKKAWDLSKCLSEYYGGTNLPIRKNLEFFIGLRNKIEHRYVPAIDPHVCGECQAMLLNFDDMLTQEFGDYYALREYLTVPLQTAVLRSVNQMEAMRKFQGRQYDQIKDYIDTFRADLPDEIVDDPKFSFRVYLIPKVGNHQNSSDLAFEYIKEDDIRKELEKQIVLVRQKKVPVVNPGRLKPKDVVECVKSKIGKPFGIHNHTQAWKKYDVRKSGENPEGCNTKYCQFDDAHRDYIYTEKWVEFLVNKLSDESEYQSLIEYKW